MCYVPYHRSNSVSVSAQDALQMHSWSSNITSCMLPFSVWTIPVPARVHHMQNHHYPILWHFTCQRTPSNTCIITQHLRLQLHTEQIPHVQFPLPHVYFHFTICSFHITMHFLIFDILSIMCSLPSYKPLCFSSSYLNIEYLSCHSQFWIST